METYLGLLWGLGEALEIVPGILEGNRIQAPEGPYDLI